MYVSKEVYYFYYRCFERLRPYYGLLLLVDTKQLLRSLSPDASPGLAKLIRVYSPIKSFSTLSVDTSLGLTEVCNELLLTVIRMTIFFIACFVPI